MDEEFPIFYLNLNLRRTYNDCFKSTQKRQNLEKEKQKGASFELT